MVQKIIFNLGETFSLGREFWKNRWFSNKPLKAFGKENNIYWTLL